MAIDTTPDTKFFYLVSDPDTGKEYYIPDISDNVDLIKVIRESIGAPRAHPPEVRAQAAALWVVLGSSRKVGKILNIDDSVVRSWYREPWWHIAVREIRKSKNEELDAQLTGLLEQTISEIQDRVTNGETVVDKEGNLRQIPVPLKTLATTMGIVFDKRVILRADPNAKIQKTDMVQHLEKVAAKLEKLVGKIPEPITIEGEIIESIKESSSGSVE